MTNTMAYGAPLHADRPPGPIDPRELRDVFGTLATGVTVVTCRTDDGTPHGAMVNAFASVSLDPALAQVVLARTSLAGRLMAERPFAINILAADQTAVAWHFAGRSMAQPPSWVEGATPSLPGAAATITCRPWRIYEGGDHLIVIGEVERVEITGAEPLLFHGGAFRTLRPLRADTTSDIGVGYVEPGIDRAAASRQARREGRRLFSVGA